MAGDFEDLVERVRDHYLAQFWALADQESKRCTNGTAELKIGLNGQSHFYKNRYCVDYATNDGKIAVVEFVVEKFLMFDPVTFDCGRATLLVDHLRWGDVVIEHDLPDVPADAIEEWFERWFDPDDAAMRQTEIIHALVLRPGQISLDMGTASPESLYDMLGLLEHAGARTLRITADSAEPDSEG
jgi:hypothetical protein